MTKTLTAAFLAAAGLTLAGCAAQHLSSDFGVALRQDLASQIADPDPRYVGDPAPGSDGSRVSLAQKRYQTGTTIQPVSATADKDVVGGGSGGQGAAAAATP